MTNYDMKKDYTLEKIAKTLEKLDTQLAKILEETESESKFKNIKLWTEEKKAVHEIKKILHEVGKYEKYNEKECDQERKALAKSEGV